MLRHSCKTLLKLTILKKIDHITKSMKSPYKQWEIKPNIIINCFCFGIGSLRQNGINSDESFVTTKHKNKLLFRNSRQTSNVKLWEKYVDDVVNIQHMVFETRWRHESSIDLGLSNRLSWGDGVGRIFLKRHCIFGTKTELKTNNRCFPNGQ